MFFLFEKKERAKINLNCVCVFPPRNLNTHTVQSTTTGTLRFPHWRRSDLTTLMSRRGLLLGGSSAKWKISSALYRSAAKVTLTVCAWKRLAPSSLSPWPYSPHVALLLQPWGWRTFVTHLKGDDIFHIISWEHQGCVSLVGLIYNTASECFSDGWLIRQTWNSSLLNKDVCVRTCTQMQSRIGAFWV